MFWYTPLRDSLVFPTQSINQIRELLESLSSFSEYFWEGSRVSTFSFSLTILPLILPNVTSLGPTSFSSMTFHDIVVL